MYNFSLLILHPLILPNVDNSKLHADWIKPPDSLHEYMLHCRIWWPTQCGLSRKARASIHRGPDQTARPRQRWCPSRLLVFFSVFIKTSALWCLCYCVLRDSSSGKGHGHGVQRGADVQARYDEHPAPSSLWQKSGQETGSGSDSRCKHLC